MARMFSCRLGVRSVPDEGDLFQRLAVKAFDAFGDITSARMRVKGDSKVVFLKRPDDHACHATRRDADADRHPYVAICPV